MSSDASRHYFVTSAALQNNIGALHFRCHDAHNAMEAFSESIRLRKDLVEHNEKIQGSEEPECTDRGRQQESHLRALQQQLDTMIRQENTNTSTSTPPFIKEYTQSEQFQSALIGLHYFSLPIEIDIHKQRPGKSSFRGSTNISGEDDEETAFTLFNIAILHLSESNYTRARLILELAIDILPASVASVRSSSPRMKIFHSMLFNNLGYAALCEGGIQHAVQCFQQASCEAVNLARATAHQETPFSKDQRGQCVRASIAAMYNLARAYDLANLHREALEVCQVADKIAMDSATDNDNHLHQKYGINLSSSLFIKAQICCNLQDTKQSLQLYRSFLRQSIDRYGSSHYYVYVAFEEISRLSRLAYGTNASYISSKHAAAA